MVWLSHPGALPLLPTVSLHVSMPHFMLCLGLKYPSRFCLLGLPPCKILDNLAHATWVKASLIPYSESINKYLWVFACVSALWIIADVVFWWRWSVVAWLLNKVGVELVTFFGPTQCHVLPRVQQLIPHFLGLPTPPKLVSVQVIPEEVSGCPAPDLFLLSTQPAPFGYPCLLQGAPAEITFYVYAIPDMLNSYRLSEVHSSQKSAYKWLACVSTYKWLVIFINSHKW